MTTRAGREVLLVGSAGPAAPVDVLRRLVVRDYEKTRASDPRLPPWDESMLLWGPSQRAEDESEVSARARWVHRAGWLVDLP